VYHDLDDTNKDILNWLETVADIRIHGTTREKLRIVLKRTAILKLFAIESYDISEK